MSDTFRPVRRSRSEQIAKTITGSPIPVLLVLYCIALLSSMSGMEIMGWATGLFTILYIIVDRFSIAREFKFFTIGADIPLIGLLITAAIGLKVNAPQADFVFAMGSLRWIILLYLLTYSMDLFPGLNIRFRVLMVLGTVVGAYAIFQHFSGIDLRQEWGLRSASAVTRAPIEGSDLFQSVGLFSHHLTYGYSFAMLFCFPIAAFLLSHKKDRLFRFTMIFSSLIIGLSLLWTYGRGVWISAVAAVLIMTLYISRKYTLLFIFMIVSLGGVYYLSSSSFQNRVESIWSTTHWSNADRRDIWRANIAMFQDHPWIGVGYMQNEDLTQEYFKKIGIENKFGGHAHNTYFQMLSTTGMIGFTCYMLFILSFLLMTHRLWTEVPRTHYWHRVFVLGALGAQVAMHLGGLTQWNFGDAEVNHLFIFILAVMAYMNERYIRGIVPDDQAL